MIWKRKCRLLIYDILLIKNSIHTSEKIKLWLRGNCILEIMRCGPLFMCFPVYHTPGYHFLYIKLLNHSRSSLLYPFKSWRNSGSNIFSKLTSLQAALLIKTSWRKTVPKHLKYKMGKHCWMMLWKIAVGRGSQKSVVFMMKWVDRQPLSRGMYLWNAWHWKMKAVQSSREDLSLNLHLTNPPSGTQSLPLEDFSHSVCHYTLLFAPCWTFSQI